MEYPDTAKGEGVELTPPGFVAPLIRGYTMDFAVVLMATVCLVLLIACINLASLLLARASGRRKEIAIRLSLGASRARLIRQLLTESVLLAVMGGVFGTMLAYTLARLVSALRLPVEFPLTIDLKVDWRVLVFSLVLSFVTGVLFGLVPAFQATKADLVPALKDGDSLGGYRRSIIRNILVVAQIGLSLVLLISSGLVVRSLQHVQLIGPGFETDRALTLSVDLGLQGYDDPKGKQFYHALIERVQSLPGVKSASIASILPLSLNFSSSSIYIEGRPITHGTDTPEAYYYIVGNKYFETMGIPIVAGREFDPGDTENVPRSAVINETFARMFWPGENAIGKRFKTGSSGNKFVTVVGIARDGKYFTLGEKPHATYYNSLTQVYPSNASLIVRTSADPKTMVTTIRREVQQLDPNLPVFDVKTLSEHMGVSLFPLRVGAWVVGSFGILALTLAAIGIYGTMAYSVSQRTREVGIRMALGAGRSNVLGLMVKGGLILACIGLVIGLGLAFLAAPVLKLIISGISATDFFTFTCVTVLLAAVVLVACLIPALKATRVDPMVALRYE